MSSSTSRIAKNTLLLYFRQILIMLVSLYTVRIVLNVLGAEDYGTYNVVAGVVTMFGFLSGAMATASQRYFAFDLGKQDYEHLKTTFSVTFQIYVLLAVVIVVLAETVGLWFVMNKLVISPERLSAAIWIYQATVVSFLLTLITTPYMASIIAHENMNIYAYVSIVEAVLKFAIVFLLQVLLFDKLVLYGFLLMAVSFIITAIYRVYCRKHYVECRFQFVKDKALFKEIVSYSGWNLFGHASTVLKNQGVSIVINLFFGTVVNAAQGIANQIRSAVTSFSGNFMQAVKPQIVKQYAAKNYDELWKIVFWGCKTSYFLILIAVFPLFSNLDYILTLWLKNVPEYTVVFVRLLFIETLVESISLPMATVNQATGKIALYQAIIGVVVILNLPLSYLALRYGCQPYTIYVIGIILMLGLVFVRLGFLKRVEGFSIKAIFNAVFIRVILITAILVVANYYLNLSKETMATFILDISIKVFFAAFIIYFLGLTRMERQSIINIVRKKIKPSNNSSK
ncbi:MAG: oligosaccharide flippase family protein [Paludibacteraceae bacterium]|nr:oligosaccharide flippase family protein [Paludibacteraceae bacterium]